MAAQAEHRVTHADADAGHETDPATNLSGPPRDLDDELELDPASWPSTEVYRLLTGLVVPRPVAWVSTHAADGTRNLAPHSFFTVLAEDPPHVGVVSIGRKDTLRNVEETREMVVSIASHHDLEALNATAIDVAPEVDEFTHAGVEATPSRVVAPPRVASAHAHLECRVVAIHTHGDGHLIVGEVVHVHVSPSVWRDGRVDAALLDPVMRLAGSAYAKLGEQVRLVRPRVPRPPADVNLD